MAWDTQQECKPDYRTQLTDAVARALRKRSKAQRRLLAFAPRHPSAAVIAGDAIVHGRAGREEPRGDRGGGSSCCCGARGTAWRRRRRRRCRRLCWGCQGACSSGSGRGSAGSKSAHPSAASPRSPTHPLLTGMRPLRAQVTLIVLGPWLQPALWIKLQRPLPVVRAMIKTCGGKAAGSGVTARTGRRIEYRLSPWGREGWAGWAHTSERARASQSLSDCSRPNSPRPPMSSSVPGGTRYPRSTSSRSVCRAVPLGTTDTSRMLSLMTQFR